MKGQPCEDHESHPRKSPETVGQLYLSHDRRTCILALKRSLLTG